MITISLNFRLLMLLWLVIPMLFIGWLVTAFTGKYINTERVSETQFRESPREVPAYEE